MKRKLKNTEIALLVLPALLLAGSGILLRGQNNKQPTNQLVMNNIKFRLLPSRGEVSGRVGITVFIGYEGQEPKWWKKPIAASWLQNMRFVNQQGKEYSLYSFGGAGRGYNIESQSHIFEYTCTVPTGYNIIQRGSFKATAVFANQLVPLKPLGVARFSTPVQVR